MTDEIKVPDAVKPIEAANLAGVRGIRHGFFTRAGGVSEGLYAGLNCGVGSKDDTARVLENRARVARHLGAGAPDVVTLYQVHSATALAVDQAIPRDSLPKADAVVTRTRGLAIGVLTADCTPVLLADGEAGVVGAAHAGWRGAAAGVIEAAIAAMEQLGADRSRIAAAIGPTINQPAYEVGPDFQAAVSAEDEESLGFFAPMGRSSKAHFDLPGYVEARLKRAGIKNIERQSLCTYDHESLLFSFRRATHRAEPDYGRQISAIVVT
ncbi:MAG: peptidoglycan editing factor PgeF [Hyphomicrobiaceae bacterium]|nr:peptidoglycan editing factor PgeF [Hyphomicrobiaceae bacterium]